MVNALDQLLPFQKNQGLSEDKLIGIIEFALPCKCHQQILVQGFDSAENILNKIVKLCKQFEMAK